MNNITDLISTLRDKHKIHENTCDATSSLVHIIDAPVPVEQYRDLLIMSSEFNRDLSCLAGDLLAIAIREAFSSLSEEERSRLKEQEVALEKRKEVQEMEDCKYDAGGT